MTMLRAIGRHSFAAAAAEPSVLVLNAGPSSLKFALLPESGKVSKFRGRVEQLETPECRLVMKGSRPMDFPNLSLKDGVQAVLDRLPGGGTSLVGVGHRIVHGGLKLHKPTRVDEDVLEEIRKVVPLAPLHNPAGIATAEAA